ncbi:MAG: NAD-binding protein, partial [Betaproteobacteria bacterium]
MTKGNLGVVSDDLKQAVLIVGYGDVGARVARLLRSTRSVYALIRNPARAAAVASDGAVAVIGDL